MRFYLRGMGRRVAPGPLTAGEFWWLSCVHVAPLRGKIIPVGVAQLVTTGNHFGRPEFNPQPRQKNPAPARFALPAVVFFACFLHVFLPSEYVFCWKTWFCRRRVYCGNLQYLSA